MLMVFSLPFTGIGGPVSRFDYKWHIPIEKVDNDLILGGLVKRQWKLRGKLLIEQSRT